MARRSRKQKESFFDLLLGAPWQASIMVGVVVFISVKWILPIIGAGNIFLKPMTQALSEMAWLFSGFFFLIGAAVFAKTAFFRPKQSSCSAGSAAAGNDPASAWQPPPWANTDSKGRREPLDIHGAFVHPPSENFTKPTEWSVDTIRELEWKRFEDVCQKYYETLGIRSETTALGPDGGIDIRIYLDDAENTTSIVQCKAWGSRMVGVKPVRELLGVMTHEKIAEAIFMTSGNFSDDAKEVAKDNRITLIDGNMLLVMIKRLPEEDQQSLLNFATDGDYKIPTCPSCGIKMRHISSKTDRPDFWGCKNYPRCRQKLGMRREA